MTGAQPTAVRDWRVWSYDEWNARLAAYYFSVGPGERETAVEQLPATPHELALVTGDPDANAEEVVARFVAVLKWRLPPGESFRTFCLKETSWKPTSDTPPRFFGMLWLTCLVAYGYPFGREGGFHERMDAVFERRQAMECLPDLWLTLAEWTLANAPAGRIRRLVLPPRDSFRKRIGASWFLAFPHDRDRAKLRHLLETNELLGDEPPMRRVLKLLQDAKASFSQEFRKDLEHFVERFVETGADVRNSAFWRAVRQEALRTGLHGRREAGTWDVRLLAEFDDDEDLLRPFLACPDDAALPPELEAVPLGFEHDGLTRLVRLADAGAPDPVQAAVTAALEGGSLAARPARQFRRGVLIFRALAGGAFELVSGTDAEQADMALVRDDLVGAFVSHFGGRREPALLQGWSQVVDCRVRIAKDAPAGLEGATHLQATMASPSVRIVGGVRGDDGHVALEGFLPRIRFAGASSVDILDVDGNLVCAATKSMDIPDEWVLPDAPLADAPGRYLALVRWPAADGDDNTASCEFALGHRHLTHDYKPVGSGVYALEGCGAAAVEIERTDEIPDWVSTRTPGRRVDLVGAVRDVRYLGSRLGDVAACRGDAHEWLVVGETDRPTQLLFVGDPDSPTPRMPRKSPHSRDRKVWRLAVHRSASVGVVVGPDRVDPIERHPRVQAVLASFKDRARDGADEPDETVGGTAAGGGAAWTGVEPDDRTRRLVDVFAALAVRRSGIRLDTAVEAFARATGFDRFDRSGTLYELLRAWVEVGLLDVVHARAQPVTYVVARRPGFVAYPVGRRVRATLLGLMPSFDAAEFARRAKRYGAVVTRRLAANPWQPAVFQVDVSKTEILERLSAEFELAPLRWLDPDLTVQAPDDSPGDRRPAGSAYVRERVWDWKASRFRPAAARGSDGVAVELRRHPGSCPLYVIRRDGVDLYSSELRNATLTKAYLLKYGDLPFDDDPGRPVQRTWAQGLYLPLRFGRLCAVIGEGLSGPTLAEDGAVTGYAYPLSGPYRDSLSAYLNPPSFPS
ncbi:hypothetical protein [Deinococcus depolymerans]|uniref:Uncharacterized protein n=1 Tax=Deinococcus depolymerans TaxID=392408 RepID=A0ABN1CQD6_9DEIO